MAYLKWAGVLWAGLALGLFGPAGAPFLPPLAKGGAGGVDDEAEELNEAILEANQKIRLTAREFGETLAPALELKEVELEDLKKDYKRIGLVLAKVREDMKEVPVPKKKVAQDYYKAHQEFLRTQGSIHKREFADIVKVVEDDALSAAEKKKKILAIS